MKPDPTKIDPGVELLADVPIAASKHDRFDRRALAIRLAELLVADPESAPRVVALTGTVGDGKSSVLNLVGELTNARPELATVAIDAGLHGSALATTTALTKALEKLFGQLGVVETREKVRDTLANYGGKVSNLLRFGGMQVDVAGALERSPEVLRAEIAQNLVQAGKRLVVLLDHLDRIAPSEIGAAFAALRMYAEIPNVAILIAIDRSTVPDQRAFERFVQVELVLPPADRGVLARLMIGELQRIAARLQRDLAPVIALFDVTKGAGLDLLSTPRDAKRALNALAAALPLMPVDETLDQRALALLARVLVP